MLACDRSQLDSYMLLAIAASLGAPLACAPWEIGISVGIGLVWLSRRSRHRVLLLATLLVLYQADRTTTRLQESEERYQAIRAAFATPMRCKLLATVDRSPVVFTRKKKATHRLGHARVDVRATAVDCEGQQLTLRGVVRVYDAPEHWARDDQVAIITDLAPRSLLRNPGGGDVRTRMALDKVVATGRLIDGWRQSSGRSLYASIDRARHFVRERITASYPAAAAPFARALVLGETDLEEDETVAFRRSGLAHLLAVSGTHLVIAVLVLGKALESFLVRLPHIAARIDVRRLSAVFCLAGAWLYADFAGGSGSAWRAAAMLGFAMLTRALGRHPDPLRCFALSLLMAQLLEPLAVYDMSFALSLTATAGLAIGARLHVRRILKPLVATTAAMTACAPLLLYLAPELPLVGVIANVLAAPIGELAALPLCLLHTISWKLPRLEAGLAVVASGALWVVRAIAHGASESGGALRLPPPTVWQLATIGLTLLFLHGCERRYRHLVVLLGIVVLLGAEWMAVRRGAPLGLLRVTVLDVGQGDAILVDLPNGELMLVDAGPGSTLGGHGARVVEAALRARRREHIDVLLLSHPHPDHYGGMAELSELYPIRSFWSPQLIAPDQRGRPLQRWLALLEARGTLRRGPRQLCGASQRFGEARVDLLAPCPDVEMGANINDNSLVMRIRFGAQTALFMGDAEANEERRLLDQHEDLRSDFLKVGHHGSRTSSTQALLNAVRPRHAVVSCGARNRFGHPHPQTLRALSSVPTWRTDRWGAVLWQSNGHRAQWRPAR